MKIIEPSKNKTSKLKNVGVFRQLFLVILVLFLCAGIVYYFVLYPSSDNEEIVASEDQSQQNTVQDQSNNDALPGEASGDEKYQALWYALTIPDTITPQVAPDINDDTEFTRLVSSIAESRGYQLQKIYSGDNLDFYRGVELEQSIITPLQDLIADASRSGLSLSISSAYRSLQEQETIFMERYRQQLATGKSQTDAIVAVLEGAAPPGYSKHHSGYTVDMTCSGLGAKNFIDTACDIWLSENDYAKAKQYGFIPSYPRNVDVQGPVPEPWEYNYVGTTVLRDVNEL